MSHIERLPCGCSEWEHELFDGECPPPPGPRECCGVVDDEKNLVTGVCVNGNCVEWFCACGAFTMTSMGPVGCGCDDLPSWGERDAIRLAVFGELSYEAARTGLDDATNYLPVDDE